MANNWNVLNESVKPDIQLMVNRIIDELIGEYSNREWENLSNNEKFDIIRNKYFMFDGKPKYLSEVRDLVMENMNHPFDVKFESKTEDKNMKKSIKERFNPSKYWDFTALVEQYGMEYLSENYPDDEPFSMDEFNDIVGKDCWEAVRACFYGGRYGFKNDSFNPTDDWFKYNSYGNLESIPYIDDYLENEVDEKEFYTWCVDNGYFDEE